MAKKKTAYHKARNTNLKQRLMKQYGITEGKLPNGRRCFYVPGDTPRSVTDRIAKL